MALSIKNKFDICINKGDPIELLLTTLGDVRAEIGETAVFMIKNDPSDLDVNAIFTKNITISETLIINIEVTTAETELFDIGNYFWSVKHTKNGNKYTIIPDDSCTNFPALKIKEVLING